MAVLEGDEACAVRGEAERANRELVVGGGRGFRDSQRGDQRGRGQDAAVRTVSNIHRVCLLQLAAASGLQFYQGEPAERFRG